MLQVRSLLVLPLLLSVLGLPSGGVAHAAETVLHRVNAGGAALPGTPGWSADTAASPSPLVNASATGNKTFSTTAAIDLSSPTIPAGTPQALFQTERYDGAAAPEMAWDVPVAAGKAYEVRLYFAEIYAGASSAGARVFDVLVDGRTALDDYDVFVRAGGAHKGIVERVRGTSDGTVDIDFLHVTENPAVKAVEVVEVDVTSAQLAAVPSSVGFGSVKTGTTSTQTVSLVNQAPTGGPSITISSTAITGTGAAAYADSFVDGTPVTLTPGSSTALPVRFAPTTLGSAAATLAVSHSGSSSPLTVPLSGAGVDQVPISFGKSVLGAETSSQVTSLQFGPDGKLYVAQQNGVIKVYGVERKAANSYAVTSTQTITSVQTIPNHDDDGKVNTTVGTRQVTGLVVGGTATTPVVYVSSSDPRIGGGGSGTETGLDTNSSTVSRLTWTGTTWAKTDLVRGLPRSEENHSANGLQHDPATNTLYLAMGGNTNMGAPSNNFALLSEYALSAAVLSIDLDAIGDTTYDLPTLDDEDRAGATDAGDPFGGNDGKNQARIVPGGPVQVFHPGFRNPYDLLRTRSGRFYTIDNGANAGWGDVPVGEGPAGTCTNARSEPGTTDVDTFHLVKLGGYGGHPNPTRGNRSNTFNATNPQSPVPTANAMECDWRAAGPDRGNITSYSASTNGLTEYTASNFGGQMTGDILSASFDNKVYRAKLNSTGSQLVSGSALFSAVGSTPLDITAQGDTGPFPGTVWVGDIGNGSIVVFEPADYDGSAGGTCTGVDDPARDEDVDGFSNADEIDNGTDPCSAADVPSDADGDRTSDLTDPDDDNDSRPDTSDPYAVDAKDGRSTALPLSLSWDNEPTRSGGLLNLGFTGLMTNGTSDYRTLFDAGKMTAGGAAGVTTVDEVAEGTAAGSANTQSYGFQTGFVPSTGRFTASTRILAPFAGLTPQAGQTMGLFLGTGGQDDYVSLVVSGGSGGGVAFAKEVGGTVSPGASAPVALPGPSSVDLFLTVDPATSTVQPAYAVTSGGTTGPRTALGGPVPVPPAWIATSGATAAGILSSSAGPAPTFAATWDFLRVAADTSGPQTRTVTLTPVADTTARQAAPTATAGSAPTLLSDAVETSGSPTRATPYLRFTVPALAAGESISAASLSLQVTEPTGDGPAIWRTATSWDESTLHWDGQPARSGTTAVGNYPAMAAGRVTTPLSGITAGGEVSFQLHADNGDGVSFASRETATPTARPQLVLTISSGTSAGSWAALPAMPVALGEVAAGVIGSKLYVVGEGSPATLVHDLAARTWTSSAAPRPFPGHHHAAEVVNGRLYLLGGLGAGSEGKVQIYDPTTDAWTAGAAMPFAAGSSSSAVIGGRIHVAGGIVAGSTTAAAARYDVATNTWTSLPSMPQGRNHAAAESDGTRMWVFGGRGAGSGDGNTVGNGFDTVQVYDPATGAWRSSLDAGSTLAPLPQARGGTGTAVLVGGELLVMGGETATGAGADANGVYDRVDVYDPAANRWRAGTAMPTARHGIFPVLHDGRVVVAGGGTKAGASTSAVVEVYTP